MERSAAARDLILLDLDGTLTDPGVGIVASLRHALEQLGADPRSDVELAGHIGPPLRASFRELLGQPDEATVERAVQLYRERYSARGLFENRVYPGIPALLDALAARGRRACVVTSKPRPFAKRILRHFGLVGALSATYGSRLDGSRSGKDELIAHALASEGLPPGRAVMVGDRRYDVEGARTCGVASIGVTWGYGSRAELEHAGATWICEDVAALRRTLAEPDGPGGGVG